MTLSVLTICRESDDIESLVRALEASTCLPHELVVVWYGTPRRPLPATKFTIVDVDLEPSPEDTDLARARNAAAEAAHGGQLVFVGPGCIPSRTMIEQFVRHLIPGRVIVGELRTLAPDIEDISDERMLACSQSDVDQPPPPSSGGMRQPQHYFRPDVFAISRPHFVRLGGFASAGRFKRPDEDWALWSAAKARCFRRSTSEALRPALRTAHPAVSAESLSTDLAS